MLCYLVRVPVPSLPVELWMMVDGAIATADEQLSNDGRLVGSRLSVFLPYTQTPFLSFLGLSSS
jgi:hypothetical protein